MDIYYSPYSSYSRQLATIVANNMKSVYPDPSKVNTRPTTSLGEVTRTKAVAVLAELGYHDNPADAEWIKYYKHETNEKPTAPEPTAIPR